MNKTTTITLALGVLSMLMLLLSDKIPVFVWLSTSLALFGSFIGIWSLLSLFFKSVTLQKKEKLYVVLGTTASLIAFSLGRYGLLLFIWLPGTVISVFTLRLVLSVFNKTSSSLTNPLQQKISKMEEELRQRKVNKNNQN